MLALASILTTAGLFWMFLDDTSTRPSTFDELGKQRMLATQMVSATHKLETDPEAARQQLAESADDFESTLQGLYAPSRFPGTDTETLDEPLKQTQQLWEETQTALDILLSSQPGDTEFEEARRQILDNGPQLRELSDDIVQTMRGEAESSSRRMWWVMLAAVVFNAGLLVAGWWLSRRWLVRPLGQLESAAGTLRSGRLDTRIDTDQDGEIGRLATTFNEMAREIETLVESIERERAIAESVVTFAPAGVVVHRDGQIVLADPDFLTVAGDTDVETVDEVVDWFAADDQPRVRKLMAAREDCCGPTTSCQPVELTGDEVRTVEIVSVPIDYGDDEAILSVFRDITERREFTARMMQMDRVIAVGSLVSGISHEINNPLSFVLNNLDFTLRRLDDGEPDASIREALVDAREGAVEIRDLIDRLRTFTHFDDDSPGDRCDLEPVIEAAVQMARGEIPPDTDLEVDIGDNLPVVEGDPSKLAQLFLNLLLNAADAVDEQPGASNISMTSRLDDGWIVVEVTDCGPGIDDEIADRIFDPFFTTKSPQEGTGLGLAACQDIVDSHGGIISFETTPGEGTTFIVRLPTADAGTADDGDEDSCRIAVVDDNPEVADQIRRRHGDDAGVEFLNSAHHLLGALADGKDWDVVVCNVMLPDLTGMDLFSIIDEDHPDMADRLVFVVDEHPGADIESFVDETQVVTLRSPLDERLDAIIDQRLSD